MIDLVNWMSPDGSLRVVYPLSLFHEIDFDVNDGYRRIPRGGIEVGGLLFGKVQDGFTEIHARQPIECEHVFGPSFKLSDNDLTRLRTQMKAAETDIELSALQPVGWFIAHTRSGLVLTESELKQFDEFFPGTGRLTVLVKPENFKPTRFAFLPRGVDGKVPVDGTTRAFILPLPGRAGERAEPVSVAPSAPQPPIVVKPAEEPPPPAVLAPSVPEPVAVPLPPPIHRPPAAPEAVVQTPPPAVSAPPVADASTVAIPPPPSRSEPAASPNPEPAVVERPPEREAVAPTPVWKPAVEPKPDPIPPAETIRPPVSNPVAVPPVSLRTPSAPPTTVPPVPEERTAPVSVPDDHLSLFQPERRSKPRIPAADLPQPVLSEAKPGRTRRGLILVAVALIGCGLGFLLYRQMPPIAVKVRIQPRNGSYVVTWPPEETRTSDAVLMRVNDGEPAAVPDADRDVGQTVVPPIPSTVRVLKVEIIARHRLGDSRGIAEFVR